MRLLEIVERLSIPTPKVTGYLLKLDHPRGASKDRFFMGVGFRPEYPVPLFDALLEHGDMNDIVTTESRPGAMVYTVEGEVVSPDGRNPRIGTVWQVDAGSNVARLITAVPLRRRRDM
jgi:uncharacterized protein DUF6883